MTLDSCVTHEDYLIEKEAYEEIERNGGKEPKNKVTHKTIKLSDDVFNQIAEEEKLEKDK